jgi:predicted transcriptional regulator of viral defense system
MASKLASLIAIAKKRGLVRPRDLASHRIPRVYLRRLVEKGILQRVGRGLYMFHGQEVTEHHALAEAAKRVPRGVVCLLSALQFHGMTTQSPFEVWLAIDPRARNPRSDYPPLRIVRMSERARTAGIMERRIEGVPVQVYEPAKTVADCFKYRNKIGLDVAIEALRSFLRGRRGTVDDLTRFAMICRVWNVMRSYLEAMV